MKTRAFNPIELALQKSQENKSITSYFPDAEGHTFLLHDPRLIREVFGKLHDVFVSEEHPYPKLAAVLSQPGLAALSFGEAVAGPTVMTTLENDIVMRTEGFCRKSRASLCTESSVDLSFPLSVLCFEIMVKALFDYEIEDLAEPFVRASLAHEEHLALLRRGDPKLRSSEEFLAQGKSAMQEQITVARNILEHLGKTEPSNLENSKQNLPRAMVRTLVNAYAGTAATLAWLVWVLAKEQPAQSRLRLEAQSVARGRELRGGDLAQMPFSRQVVCETLRLYPTAWTLARTARQMVSLDGTSIPAGGQVFVSPFALHRDSRYWSEPESFRPQRFESSESGGADPFAYLPFGLGKHRCVGARFAMTTLRLVIGTLVRHWKLLEVPEVSVTPYPKVALRPDPGAIVRVIPIDEEIVS